MMVERERQVERKSGPWCYELVELVWCSIEHVCVFVLCWRVVFTTSFFLRLRL